QSGDIVVDTVSATGDAMSLTANASQTEICNDALGTLSANGRGGSSYKAGSGSTTMSWTTTQSKNWDSAAVVLKPIPVPPQADVATTVTGPSTVLALSNLTYTVSVTNLGPFTATNVVVSNTLPAGVTFISASGGGVNSNGVVKWTIPNFPYTAATNFTVTVSPPLSGTLTNTVSSSATTSDLATANNNGTAANARVITDVINLPPVINDDSYSTVDDTVLTVPASGVLANDSDPEAQPLVASLVVAPTNGLVTLNGNGSLTYTPNTNYNGPDSFTYQITDGLTNSAPATVSITITAANDAPTLQPTTVTLGGTDENTTSSSTSVNTILT